MPQARVIVLAALALLPRASAAQEVVTVTVSYQEIHDRVLPFAERTVTDVALEAHLESNGDVEQREQRSSGSTQRNRAAGLKIGPGPSRDRWRIVGRNQLLNVHEFDSFSRGILVTIRGRECTAQVSYRLKPGFTDYRYRRLVTGEPAVATAVQASNVACAVH